MSRGRPWQLVHWHHVSLQSLSLCTDALALLGAEGPTAGSVQLSNFISRAVLGWHQAFGYLEDGVLVQCHRVVW
jgi:hypothetical protein